MRNSILCALAALWLTGCGNPAAKFQEGSVETPTWPALEKLQSEEGLMPVGMAAMNEEWNALKEQAKRSEFKSAVDEFANSEIPAKFASEERKAAKEEVTVNLKKLIELAESGAGGPEVQSAWEAVDKSLAEVVKVTPPSDAD